MSEFPERVYIDKRSYNADKECYYAYEESRDGNIEYIRADLIPKWQPITKEAMDGTYILTRDKNGEANVLAYIGNEWCDFIHAYRSEPGPIEWMPIPKGYE